MTAYNRHRGRAEHEAVAMCLSPSCRLRFLAAMVHTRPSAATGRRVAIKILSSVSGSQTSTVSGFHSTSWTREFLGYHLSQDCKHKDADGLVYSISQLLLDHQCQAPVIIHLLPL